MIQFKKVIYTVLGLGIVASLWFNYQYFQEKQEVQTWKKYSYNQFVSGVISGGKLLGYQTPWYDTKKASLAIGKGAMALNQWSVYCVKTTNESTPYIKEIANYLSYVSRTMGDPNQKIYEEDDEGEEYIVNITNLLIEELEENGAIGDITKENEHELFSEMYLLIPKVKEPDYRVDFFLIS